ncbi:hypothetical protein NAEGRDRAFT_81382 [Naegleria gruberi]|uniref:Thioredoxin domain-containing protein n=1 Tax=Naegleria gruberi TaxID=5762 RepID=D2VVI1_NAEGR|nr:uncharacterized protein NAEGRDRAFT_81382 [Naegleria gruberi]EFC39116.1 hypothetical protein NAEGRDRAFT_81382 [Naegleria gruberi]|eukprot:XP_002671860.1 hypothetical protein NAEGRDRAFT_81382 [Naegleria gruberi strain NEG-M]
MHQCLHCKLYRDLLKKYVNSFTNEMKGILIEFTPQSQELVIQKLKLTHLPSVTIQSKYTDQLYDCNLKENQLWECVKDAFKQSDHDLYENLKDFINMDDIKDLYLKYKNEYSSSSSNNQQQHNQQQNNHSNESPLFDFSSLKSITKIVLIAFCIVGFVIGISTLQNLLNGTRYMIFILCILTYILCMSGTVFNMIQNPPPYQYNPRENSISFFYPSMRMSFALEGYIATFVIVISSFYFIAIPYYGYYDNNNNTNNNTDNITTITSNTNNTKNTNKKNKNKNGKKKNEEEVEEEEVVEEELNEEKKKEDSHYKSVLKRLFFIWGFFITFTAAMIFFMIKTSFYLSDTPYHGWVQLLLAIFNH